MAIASRSPRNGTRKSAEKKPFGRREENMVGKRAGGTGRTRDAKPEDFKSADGEDADGKG
jgi:hypothetical protein